MFSPRAKRPQFLCRSLGNDRADPSRDKCGDGNAVDYADWLYPYLYQKKSDFDGVEKNLYADNNLGGNSKVSGSVLGARFATEKDFTAVTLNPESAADTVTASLYKFIYSYERSLQGGALCTVSAQKNSSGKYVFALNREYGGGEYLLVFDGVKEIGVNGSQYGYYYVDGSAFRGLLNMSVTFAGSFDSYLSPVTPEPETINSLGSGHRRRKGKSRKDIRRDDNKSQKLPSKMTIGEDSYVGFGSSDFTLKSTDVTEIKSQRA